MTQNVRASSRLSGPARAAFSDDTPLWPFKGVNSRGETLLTKREQELVPLVANGLTNREMSTELGVSEHTIKNHLFRIYEKLGISSRVELILYAVSEREKHTM